MSYDTMTEPGMDAHLHRQLTKPMGVGLNQVGRDEKRGMIACECQELEAVRAELQEVVKQLRSKLSPVLMQKDLGDEKDCVPPMPPMPALAEFMRKQRQQIFQEVGEIRAIIRAIEL